MTDHAHSNGNGNSNINSPISVNAGAQPLLQRLINQAQTLRVGVSKDSLGVCTVDAGLHHVGSVAAGVLIAEICMAGLGQVRLLTPTNDAATGWPTWLQVSSSQPVLACLASQYAGWSLAASKEETGGKKFFCLGSGPARALAGKESLFNDIGYSDPGRGHTPGVLVMEVDRLPPAVVVQKILRDCALQPEALSLLITPTTSLAGTTQVVARVLEVALHKAHSMGFEMSHIIEGTASAPLPAPSPDGVQAMGRTNDAILYGGRVHLQVRGGDAAAARSLAQRLPCALSRDYGRSFADIFTQAGFDFYKIDPALFAPAEVWVSHLDSGQSWHAGALNMALLRSLWLQEAA
jgi:methenyltetrahydromethanopterin cyclohydrolase